MFNADIIRRKKLHTIVFVRNGTSNEAISMGRYYGIGASSRRSLSEKGFEEAHLAGAKIIEMFGKEFFSIYLTSPFTRAKQTAAHLHIPKAKWLIDYRLREKSWGAMEGVEGEQERLGYMAYNHFLKDAAKRPRSAKVPHGDSAADVMDWMNAFFLNLETLNVPFEANKPIQKIKKFILEISGFSQKNALIVCHHDAIQAARAIIEDLSETEEDNLRKSTDPFEAISPGQIIQYTRVSPFNRFVVAKNYKWKRVIIPSSNQVSEWIEITQKYYTNLDLQDEATNEIIEEVQGKKKESDLSEMYRK